ncbi:MAG: ROK family protein [Candidatus Omnitrophica bacterium]|nr:ROK family protein [Candidatus Omnitrophota bacterium]MDD5236837.1 ROK family protein [Candidatus Omnitrophota bacterium]MDD5610794.1 ROK family protein [Candidatus Omnitrophota bacterium]
MLKKYIIAIDLGGTNLKIALLDLNFRIKARQSFPTGRLKTKFKLIAKIKSSVTEILSAEKISRSEVLGIGIGVPGPVDYGSGKVHFFPNIPGWKDVALKSILERMIRLPVLIDNDANLMCLAEARLGAAKKSKNAVCLTLGTGVGAGLLINGDLYRGSGFAAGEIGHMPLNEEGPRCNCGGRACLERYIGNKEILKSAKKYFKRNITLEELSSLAKKGNKKAKELWYNVGIKLGIVLAGVVNLINPDRMVIGGGVADAGKILFSAVIQTIKERSMPVQARSVKVLKARLGSSAGLIGAAILLKEGLNK